MPFTDIDSFTELARELATQPTLADTLQAIVERAVATVPGAEDAGITVKRGEQRYQTVAATGELPRQVDAIQYQALEGPCLQALEEHHVSRSDDLRSEARWPAFTREVTATTDVVSMMSHRLFLEDSDTIGALNLYSRRPAAFAQLDGTALNHLATHCSIALTTAAQREQNQHLRNALETNRDIGVAIGILMATRLVTKQQAFDALRITSQHTHRKLHLIALDVIETGELPRLRAAPARSQPAPSQSGAQ
ncbi:GAF domain-containing protein [Jatrophihabitans sp.]|uniref:GAF domain-containing protein n=1 Tax=Jatrophihabitans sp. TaxID=1932789 RepID=UPI002B6BFBDF|nr:GAF and ANTAR domain-containing protein [Jatrophihabitans sp.]